VPLRPNRSNLRLYFIWANTGSIITFAFLVELLAYFGGEHVAHPAIAAAGPARSCAPAGGCLWWAEQPHTARGDVVHLLVMPVAGVGQQHLRLLLDARELESRRASDGARAATPPHRLPGPGRRGDRRFGSPPVPRSCGGDRSDGRST
jgi:hypothetical protein